MAPIRVRCERPLDMSNRTKCGHLCRLRSQRCQPATERASQLAFRTTMTALKVQVTAMKVRNDNNKGCRQLRSACSAQARGHHWATRFCYAQARCGHP